MFHVEKRSRNTLIIIIIIIIMIINVLRFYWLSHQISIAETHPLSLLSVHCNV